MSLAHEWAKRASTAKRIFSALSTIEESGRASISRPCAKHEISALSVEQLSSVRLSARLTLSSNPLTRAKHKGGAKRNVANLEPI